MPESPVTPKVVKWAIDESGWTVDEVAEKLKVTPAVVSAWTSGEAKPSKGQLTDLAKKLKRPRAMFFLPEAPKANSLPDGLRTAAGVRDTPALNFNERLLVRRARRLQRLLASLAEEGSGNVGGIRHATQSDEPADVALWLLAWTGVDWETRQEWENASQAFRGWRRAVEASGVAVLALQMGKEGIRGFALSDARVPLVAVNTADIPEARSFTLFHELAHLSLKQSVPCAEPSSRARSVEQWCDRVASHVLIPRAHLSNLHAQDDLALIKRTANRFRVSRRAAAIALEEVGRVEDAYRKVEEEWPHFDREKPRGGGSKGGLTTPQRRIDELGELAVESVITAMLCGRISELYVRDYLRLDSTQATEANQLLSDR